MPVLDDGPVLVPPIDQTHTELSSGVPVMNHQVFQPAELLDGISTNHLRRQITDVMVEGVKTILVDLQDVTFMNSEAIGALVATLKAVRAGGGELYLCSLNHQVCIIFQLTQMDQVFKIHTDRQAFDQQVLVPSLSRH